MHSVSIPPNSGSRYPLFEDIQSLIGRPLFDGDTMYPKTLDEYYEWHGEISVRTPDSLVTMMLGYIHGDDEHMLLLRRAQWEFKEVYFLPGTIEDYVDEDHTWEDTLRYIETGLRRVALVARLGVDRAITLAVSGLTYDQLADIGERLEQAVDLPREYFDTIYPVVPCEQWGW